MDIDSRSNNKNKTKQHIWVEDIYGVLADEVIKELDMLKQIILKEDEYERQKGEQDEPSV